MATEWDRIHEIGYLLPEHLPDGWSVRIATERAGRPRSEWTHHLEVLADAAGKRFVVLWARRTDDSEPDDRPGAVEDVAADAFFFPFAYLDVGDPTSLAARGVVSESVGLELGVVHLASSPDDQFILRVANELGDDGRFDYAIPRSVRDAGYEPIGSAPGDTRDVSDYTVSWAPTELVGSDRNAARSAGDDGPSIFINVGARFYGQVDLSSADDAANAPISRDGELLRLDLRIDGSAVSVSGQAVTEAELRAFAASLVSHDREQWRRRLGDRLLIDNPT